jgi:TPR repeat protein
MYRHSSLPACLVIPRVSRAAGTFLLASLITIAIALENQVAAQAVQGHVVEVNGKEARIAVDRSATVTVGDRVEIFEMVPEIEVEASVGSGQVSRVEDVFVHATIDQASSDIRPDHKVRIVPRRPVEASTDIPATDAVDQSKTLFLGAFTGRVTPTLASQQNLPRAFGMLLAAIYPGSPAEKAGLRAGDIVIRAGDDWIANRAAWEKYAQKHRSQKQATMVYVRNGATHQSQIDFSEWVWPDDAEQVEFLRPFADRGEAWAQHGLATRYRDGLGISQDTDQALDWFRKAAEQGDADSQLAVGKMYLYGCTGLAQDYTEAVRWLKPAAEHGDSEAQLELGWCYLNGKGVEQDDRKAAELFLQSAQQGHAKGLYNLGFVFSHGRGVVQDPAKALVYYRQAADQGVVEALYNIGLYYRFGKGVAIDPVEAMRWFRKAADQGDVQSYNQLGEMIRLGEGVPQDYQQARQWHQKAADEGNADGQNLLGYMVLNGWGVERDYAEAQRWFQLAAEQGHAGAYNNLGDMYLNGWGVTKDYKQALQFYQKAAATGDAIGQFNVGWICFNGFGVQKNYRVAMDWYRLAAQQGNANAKFNIGTMYENGEGVPADRAEAISWYQEAAKLGFELANQRLQDLGAEY